MALDTDHGSSPDVQRDLQLAVIDHFCWWVRIDGQERSRLEAAGGKLDIATLRRIGSAYSINRNIPKPGGSGRSIAGDLCERLNALASGKTWPDDLVERAEVCCGIARDFRKNLDGDGTGPVSAVTKLMWFLRPQGWTMYDSLAREAVGASGPRDFYRRLKEKNFDALARDINDELRGLRFSYLCGERVIDLFLVRRGSPSLVHYDFPLKSWLGDLGMELEKLAERVAQSFAAPASRLLASPAE